MTKAELRSLIKNLFIKYSEIEVAHDRFIDAAIEKALAEFYNLIFLRSPHELERYTKQFGYTTAIPFVLEAGTNIYYANYPSSVSIIPIPDKSSGVRRISTIAQSGAWFYPLDAREWDLILSGTYTDTVTTKIGYVPRRTRVEFYNPGAAIIAAGCRMDLLIPFSMYEDSDYVHIPELVTNEGTGLTDRVLKILSVVPPTELNENKQFEETKK